MVTTTIKADELLAAAKHIMECKSDSAHLTIDGMGRLIIAATDLSGDIVHIRLFEIETSKFPEITTTKRFVK
jgi:hypothetical protein